MRKALVVVAVLLAGCASEDPTTDEAPLTEAAPAVALAAPTPLRFASGDYEGALQDTATFTATEQCFFDCELLGGEQVFDLSDIVPAQAPVELTVTVNGARASMSFEDASALGAQGGEMGEFDGQATGFGVIVTRGESGKVLLHVYNPGGIFSFPPNTAPSASWEARSVVRADRLVAGVPAAVPLKPGQTLNLTGESVEEAILIAPDGQATRDSTAPFSLMANGTAGEYIVLMLGQDSTGVTGPEVEMLAKRIVIVREDPQPLASGGANTWSFRPPSRPLLVGLEIESVPLEGTPFPFFSAGSTMTQFEATITTPGNAVVLEASEDCQPFVCGFVFGGFSWGFASEYLDERLEAGDYEASVTYTGNGMQAIAWSLVIE